jgi:hypothetical protein
MRAIIIRGVVGHQPDPAKSLVSSAFVQSITSDAKSDRCIFWDNTTRRAAVRRTNYRLFCPPRRLAASDDLKTINDVVFRYPAFCLITPTPIPIARQSAVAERRHATHAPPPFKPLSKRPDRDALEGVLSYCSNPFVTRQLQTQALAPRSLDRQPTSRAVASCIYDRASFVGNSPARPLSAVIRWRIAGSARQPQADAGKSGRSIGRGMHKTPRGGRK